jgi:hypothetical protein
MKRREMLPSHAPRHSLQQDLIMALIGLHQNGDQNLVFEGQLLVQVAEETMPNHRNYDLTLYRADKSCRFILHVVYRSPYPSEALSCIALQYATGTDLRRGLDAFDPVKFVSNEVLPEHVIDDLVRRFEQRKMEFLQAATSVL